MRDAGVVRGGSIWLTRLRSVTGRPSPRGERPCRARSTPAVPAKAVPDRTAVADPRISPVLNSMRRSSTLTPTSRAGACRARSWCRRTSTLHRDSSSRSDAAGNGRHRHEGPVRWTGSWRPVTQRDSSSDSQPKAFPVRRVGGARAGRWHPVRLPLPRRLALSRTGLFRQRMGNDEGPPAGRHGGSAIRHVRSRGTRTSGDRRAFRLGQPALPAAPARRRLLVGPHSWRTSASCFSHFHSPCSVKNPVYGERQRGSRSSPAGPVAAPRRPEDRRRDAPGEVRHEGGSGMILQSQKLAITRGEPAKREAADQPDHASPRTPFRRPCDRHSARRAPREGGA